MAEELASIRVSTLTADQLALIAALGRPEIIGRAGSALFYIDEAQPDMPWLSPPYLASYDCPVVMIGGQPRRIEPNGDLCRIGMDKVTPLRGEWLD